MMRAEKRRRSDPKTKLAYLVVAILATLLLLGPSRASTRRRRDVLDLKGEDLEKKARLVGKVALLETENFDEENGRCLDASEECSLTFRFEPQPIWNANAVINGTAGVLNIPHPITGKVDAAFVCKLGGIKLSEDHWLTHAEAHIQKHPDPVNEGFEYDVVHHFNMFSCERGVSTRPDLDLDENMHCDQNLFMHSSPKCNYQMSYDKGAVKFGLPPDSGFLLGPSNSYAREYLFQVHYLVPEHYDEIMRRWGPVYDSSAYKITLRRRASGERDPLGIIALNDMRIRYKPGRTTHHQYRVPYSDTLETLMKGDFDTFGSVQPVAVHLHAHSTTKKIWVEHKRGYEKLGEYGRIDPYWANGPDQTFFLLPEQDRTRPLLRGDDLTVNCFVDTAGKSIDTLYGVSHQTEMCGIILVYRNHNYTSGDNYRESNAKDFLPASFKPLLSRVPSRVADGGDGRGEPHGAGSGAAGVAI